MRKYIDEAGLEEKVPFRIDKRIIQDNEDKEKSSGGFVVLTKANEPYKENGILGCPKLIKELRLKI